jgi:hypothetical protein
MNIQKYQRNVKGIYYLTPVPSPLAERGIKMLIPPSLKLEKGD